MINDPKCPPDVYKIGGLGTVRVGHVDEEGSSVDNLDSNRTSNTLLNWKGPSESYRPTFQNGVGFDNGNGLWSGEQGFTIGGEERLRRLNGYLLELAAAVYVCRGGVQRVHVVDGTLRSLLLELFTRDGAGNHDG